MNDTKMSIKFCPVLQIHVVWSAVIGRVRRAFLPTLGSGVIVFIIHRIAEAGGGPAAVTIGWISAFVPWKVRAWVRNGVGGGPGLIPGLLWLLSPLPTFQTSTAPE